MEQVPKMDDGNDRKVTSPHLTRDLHAIEVPHNKEGARIIWLDATIDDSIESRAAQSRVLDLNPAAQFYTDLS
ncbi:unnamed protein product, partial [Didymodactylos carnosus]